jgi:GTPase-associated protein 1, N-terminal domain type 1
MQKDLLIHQTLHGYSEGHRLLATSYQLSEKEQRTLLSLSDRSGDIVNGFDAYITGYPLPESKFYALAMTWNAPEMERPGCVWTHTLLVERKYFQRITNIHPLKSLFVRPQKGKQHSAYNEPVIYSSQNIDDSEFVFPQVNAADAAVYQIIYSVLFNQLYEKVKSVVLLAGDSEKYEDLILSLWGQQWPQLRSRFTFCTGSINGRTLQKHPFTLQVAPYQSHSIYAHKYPRLTVIDSQAPQSLRPRVTGNVDYRVLRSKKDPLIKFVWHYGPRMKPFRKNFGWLVRFYNLTHEVSDKPINLPKITEYLASKFPAPEEMPDLKAALYGGNAPTDTYVRPLGNEETLLTELFKTEFANIFAVSDLLIFERTTNLCKTSPQSVIRIVSSHSSELELNPIRLEFFQAAAKVLTPDQSYLLSRENTLLLLTLIRYNPNLAATPSLWLEGDSRREEIFKFLSGLWYQEASEGSVDWEKIVHAILDANADSFAEQLYEMVGARLIPFVLDWHSHDQNRNLRHPWLNYLEKNQGKVMEWVSHVSDVPLTKALAAKVLSPHSQPVLEHGSYPWLDLAEHGIAEIKDEDLVQVAAFLLALGFVNVDRGAERLVAASYEPVYNAALTNSIPWRSWSYLDKLAPSEALIFEWDKCRRLEEALVSKIKKNHWSDDLLLRAAKSPRVFWNVLKTANDSSSGRKLLWRLYEKVVSGSIGATLDQRIALESYCSKS